MKIYFKTSESTLFHTNFSSNELYRKNETAYLLQC